MDATLNITKDLNNYKLYQTLFKSNVTQRLCNQYCINVSNQYFIIDNKNIKCLTQFQVIVDYYGNKNMSCSLLFNNKFSYLKKYSYFFIMF